MAKKTFMEALEDSEKRESPLEDCIISLAEKEPLNPVIDHLKQSAFQPDIQSYVTLNAKIYEDKTYWLELHAKYFDTEMEMFLHPHHGQLDEAMKYLKSLNQLTGEMIHFMKRNELRSPIDNQSH